MANKLKIKFVYKGQIHSEVKQMQPGPLRINNLLQSYLNPIYEPISTMEEPKSNNSIPLVSVHNSKPQSPLPPNQSLKRVKSEQTFKTNQNIQTEGGDDKENPYQEQVIQAPNEPKNRQAIKEQIKNKKTAHKEHKPEKNSNKMTQLQIGHKLIQATAEKLVLKAPSYKIQAHDSSETKQVKKGYSKAQNVQKYLYNGIPERKEEGLFGCCGFGQGKSKTYKAQH